MKHLLVASMCMSTLLIPTAFAAFSDVAGTKHETEINYLKSHGIVSGVGDGTKYEPNATISRAAFGKIVAGVIAPEDDINMCDVAANRFSDQEEGQWYEKYLCFLRSKNVFTGYPDGTVKPANPISFVEAAAVIARALELPMSETEVWYEGPVRALADKSAIATDVNAFDQQISRGVMAAIMHPLHAKVYDKPSKTYEELAGLAVPSVDEEMKDMMEEEKTEPEIDSEVTEEIEKMLDEELMEGLGDDFDFDDFDAEF